MIIVKFSVTQIKKNTYDGPFTFAGEVDITELETLNNDIRKTFPATVEGNCSLQGDEIVFTLAIQGKLILPCARTLVDVTYPYTINVVEVFSTSPYYGEEEEENDIHEVKGELIDLSPFIKENIILNLPFRVFSEDKDVLDKAIFKGEGWELTSEDEQEQAKVVESDKIDPRLKKLKTLLDDKERE